MKIRPLRPSDFEPLHALYLSQIAHMPHPLPVSIEEFAAGLTTTRYQEDEHWNEAAHRTLVAVRADQPVAFASASSLAQDARYSHVKAGTSVRTPQITDLLNRLSDKESD